MWDALWRMLAGLQPEPGADPVKQYDWDRRIGLTLAVVVLMTIMLVLVTVVAFGFMPFVHPGFVRADELPKATQQAAQQLQTQIAAVQAKVDANAEADKKRWAIQLANAIVEIRAKHCKAQTDEGRQMYWKQITDMLGTYTDLTGKVYIVPACTDL